MIRPIGRSCAVEEPAPSGAEGTPYLTVLSPPAQGVSTTAVRSHPPAKTSYGTLSLATSDLLLSFPRKSTADTE